MEDEYHVKVDMKAAPFEIDCSGETVLKKSDLKGKE